MLRTLLAIVAIAAVVVPAMAYEETWDGAPDGDLTVYLELDCYVQIEWQDTDIVFDEAGDWWCATREGVGYSACPDPEGKYPTDPWAGDSYYAGAAGMYYESADGAVIFIRSNNPLTMDVHVNGNLHSTNPDCGDCYIPTWFTLAAAPFMVEGVWTGVGNIPGDGWGTYIHEDAPPDPGVLGYNDAFYGIWPNQKAFPCDPASNNWVLGPLCPGLQGTLKFLARINRHGMVDPGGDYTTWLDVQFTSS